MSLKMVYQCPTCKNTFDTESDVFNHYVREHVSETLILLNFSKSINHDDLGYFLACLKSANEDYCAERFYNS